MPEWEFFYYSHYFCSEMNNASMSIAGMQDKLLQPNVKMRQRLTVLFGDPTKTETFPKFFSY